MSEEAHLRHVEKDVLIPKKMREKAKELCADKVEGGIFSCRSGIDFTQQGHFLRRPF